MIDIYKKIIKLRKVVGAVLEADAAVKTRQYSYKFKSLPPFWDRLTKEADKIGLFVHGYHDDDVLVVDVIDLDSGESMSSRKRLFPKDTFQQDGAQTSYFFRRMLFRLLGMVDQGDSELPDTVLKVDDKDLEQVLKQAMQSKKNGQQVSALQVIDYFQGKNYELSEDQVKLIRETFESEF
jgi:hypothetical protein